MANHRRFGLEKSAKTGSDDKTVQKTEEGWSGDESVLYNSWWPDLCSSQTKYTHTIYSSFFCCANTTGALIWITGKFDYFWAEVLNTYIVVVGQGCWSVGVGNGIVHKYIAWDEISRKEENEVQCSSIWRRGSSKSNQWSYNCFCKNTLSLSRKWYQ